MKLTAPQRIPRCWGADLSRPFTPATHTVCMQAPAQHRQGLPSSAVLRGGSLHLPHCNRARRQRPSTTEVQSSCAHPGCAAFEAHFHPDAH